ADTAYLDYVTGHQNRPPRVFAGANDGMVHVFDAATGAEVYAYIPSMVVPTLNSLAASPYAHTHFVDGPMTAADVFFGGNWETVVVGGLGAGGVGHFALSATSATVASEADAMSKILWEFNAGSAGAANLGYSYSRTSIVQMNNGQWVAVFGNGYLSATGVASLYVLDISDGSVVREIVVPDANANGLSSPTLIDTNGDLKVDTGYAGDRNGNLWKFDLTDTNPANWSVSGGKPLFQTDNSSGKRLPIVTAPEVGNHPVSGFMVYVGTGELFTVADSQDKTLQAVYGVWDKGWAPADLPIGVASLAAQQMFSNVHAGVGEAVRTASNNVVDWATHRGWVMPLLIAGGGALDQGERVLQDLTLRDGRVQFVAHNPTIPTGDNWFIQLNSHTGGAPGKTIVDITGDNTLTIVDNVDGDGNGVVEDTPLDRVVGFYLGFGLSSRPTIGFTTKGDAVIGTSSALFNKLEAIAPTDLTLPNDPGLIGGHFDLDTAHNIYTFSNGTTDDHVHQWDDKYNRTTIDYFDIFGNDPLADIDAITNSVPTRNTPFFLTISNSALSPGGIIEINGASLGVTQYQALQTRWLNNALAVGERFPIYKLNPVTPAEKAAGWVQLTSLKISFDAFAILKGDLVPTETSCVRGNDPGALGEYRNGALTLQALDASGFNGISYDAVNDIYFAANTALHGTHHYAMVHPDSIVAGQTEYTQSLHWESTVFWHWKGGCYGTQLWQDNFQACLIDRTAVCWNSDSEKEDKAKKKKKKKKKKKDDDEDSDQPVDPGNPPPPGTPPTPVDPGHDLESVTTADDNFVGRLFWRELVPDN
ncbi:MAG: pilus assembly protein, partial [Gammaproteobacteria bacterium]